MASVVQELGIYHVFRRRVAIGEAMTIEEAIGILAKTIAGDVAAAIAIGEARDWQRDQLPFEGACRMLVNHADTDIELEIRVRI